MPRDDDLADLREDYDAGSLDAADLDPDPLVMLRRWLDEAIAAHLPDPTAMVLCTVDATGRPSARTVLLKGLQREGLDFFTNYASRKGEDLAGEDRVAVVFAWLALQRQVRVEGRAARLAEADSDAYFASRPRASQLGAWASPQSRVVASRQRLEERYAEAEARFAGGPVPRPAYWGGYRIAPEAVELWQGRSGRMHDRLRYRHAPAAGRWLVERLAP